MFPTDLWQLVINSSGAGLVTALFVFYLLKRDKKDTEKDKMFNSIIQDYLKESTSVKVVLAEKLQKLTDTLDSINRRIKKQ